VSDEEWRALNWPGDSGSIGDKPGLAHLDLEEAICLQSSFAGVGAETCPTAEAVRGDLWARSFGEWQGLNCFGLLTYQGLGVGLS